MLQVVGDPYYWAGLKAYDLVAGTQGLTLSRFTSPAEAQRQFPTLAGRGPNGDTLKGAVCPSHSPSQLASFLRSAFNTQCTADVL